MDNKLAIVIPAYKFEYLENCLGSIANQTNKNFTLYIGNDDSPHDIKSIVFRYNHLINLRYKKFDNNLGGTSLVKQWQRCIDMIEDEAWIWLFSDDDMIDPDCVDSFFKTVKENPCHDVFRFNLQVINTNGNLIRTTVYPKEENVNNFLMNRFALNYDSAITNYIFRRKVYDDFGLIEFPLAWCSDDASVANFSIGKLIVTMPGIFVQWRLSASNISSLSDERIQREKIYARLDYIRWLYASGKFPFLNKNINKHIILNWMIGPKCRFEILSEEENKNLLKQTEKIIGKRIISYKLRNSVINLRYRIKLRLKLIQEN